MSVAVGFWLETFPLIVGFCWAYRTVGLDGRLACGKSLGW